MKTKEELSPNVKNAFLIKRGRKLRRESIIASYLNKIVFNLSRSINRQSKVCGNSSPSEVLDD